MVILAMIFEFLKRINKVYLEIFWGSMKRGLIKPVVICISYIQSFIQGIKTKNLMEMRDGMI